MANVEFDGDQSAANYYTSHKIIGEPEVPGMTKLLLKSGLTKSKKGAFHCMVAIIVVAIVASAALLAWNYGLGGPKPIPYDAMSAAQQKKVPSKERTYITHHLNNQNPS